MTDDFLDFPDNFRQDVLGKIIKAIDRSESVTLIAPPGMGKTLTLQLLHKKTGGKSYYLDLNSKWDKQAFSENVIILDHTETLCKPENEKHQLFFRSLRDANRDHLSFIFAINPNIASDFDLFGPIKPTVLENIIYLEPLNPNDAKTVQAKSEKLYKGKLTPVQRRKILALSGGIPRLIKRLTKLSIDNISPATDLRIQNDLQEISEFLSDNPQIKWRVPLLNKEHAGVEIETVGKIKFSQNLSRQEYDLAKLLIEKERQLVSREEMIKAVWPKNLYETSEHALDQMIHRLRKKLEAATPKCALITYRGRGCKLEVGK